MRAERGERGASRSPSIKPSAKRGEARPLPPESEPAPSEAGETRRAKRGERGVSRSPSIKPSTEQRNAGEAWRARCVPSPLNQFPPILRAALFWQIASRGSWMVLAVGLSCQLAHPGSPSRRPLMAASLGLGSWLVLAAGLRWHYRRLRRLQHLLVLLLWQLHSANSSI